MLKVKGDMSFHGHSERDTKAKGVMDLVGKKREDIYHKVV